MAEQKIKAVMIVEIMGRPAEHLAQALKDHVGKLNEEKEVNLISESYSEPKIVESQNQQAQELYTCFSEVEFEANSFYKMTEVVFDYMPSSFELLTPEKIELNLEQATSFLNTLTGRLHRYDELAKIARAQAQAISLQFQKAIKEGKIQVIQKTPEEKAKKQVKKKVVKKSNKK